MAVTLQAVRRRVADRLDDIAIHQVDSATSTTAVVFLLGNASTSASSELFDGRWVYVASGANAGQQRLVAKGGYAPSTGTLTIYPVWAAPAVADELELTSLFPCVANTAGQPRGPGEDTSYRTLINRAASRLGIRDQVTVPITTSDRISLSAYGYWLTSEARLLRVLEPSPIAGRSPTDASWRGPRLVFPGGVPTLELGAPFLSASGSLTLEVLRPANTLINGVESSLSAALDTDTFSASIDDLVAVALEEAYFALSNRYVARAEGTAFSALYEQQSAIVQGLAALDRTRMAPAAPAAREEAA